MSLNRQLWIAIITLMVVILGATFFINGTTSSRYLQEQLTLKNSDDATALAVSLSQQGLDITALEVQLAAQLDMGTYQALSLQSPDGSMLFERERKLDVQVAPGWYQRLFPINPEPGRAQVSSGWNQLGTLTLRSADDFAYRELWASAKRTFMALLLATIVAGALGSFLLRRITKPLGDVVSQANAISERRFMTIAEPSTAEFAQVTRALNRMTERVQQMLESSAQRLAVERDSRELDAVTGLLARDAFMERFDAHLTDDSAAASGSLVMLRIERLATANQEHGRAAIDEALQAISQRLQNLCSESNDWLLARLGGADLVLLAPVDQDPEVLGASVQATIRNTLNEMGLQDSLSVPTACSEYAFGDQRSDLLTELDAALLASLQAPSQPVTSAQKCERRRRSRRTETVAWRARTEAALLGQSLEQCLDLATFPVVAADQELIHDEAMVRLRDGATEYPAAVLLPWAYRLGLVSRLDRAVITRALTEIATRVTKLSVNLTLEAVREPEFLPWLSEQLTQSGASAHRLDFEVTEAAFLGNREAFGELFDCAKQHGVGIGLDHVGLRLEAIGQLGDTGVDFLKIDKLFVHDIDTNGGKQSLVQTYATLAQTLGIQCIVEGVRNERELQAALQAGATGATGVGVRLTG